MNTKAEEINTAIATYLGWKWKPKGDKYGPLVQPWVAPDGSRHAEHPDWAEDQNASHELWGTLGWEEKNECVQHLKEIVTEAQCEAFFATAVQRAEAFVKTVAKLVVGKDETLTCSQCGQPFIPSSVNSTECVTCAHGKDPQ
jgi:hypothetical protein